MTHGSSAGGEKTRAVQDQTPDVLWWKLRAVIKITLAGAFAITLATVVHTAMGLAAGFASFQPLAFDPPPPPVLEGALAPNEALRQAEILAVGHEVTGTEDLAVDQQGRVYGGTVTGDIIRLSRGPSEVTDPWQLEIFAKTGGRPLGLHFDAEGRLVVADAERGLLRLNEDGIAEVLSDSADGRPFHFTDDVDIASDGRIYFSDASTYAIDDYLFDLLDARPHGRLLRYDPASGVTETLLDNLYFANGVALSQNEDFVLVNETYRYRITRYWLSGPKAGSADIFADNLPGFADGISSDRQGQFWVAFFTVRNPLLDTLHPSPLAKAILAKLPKPLWPQPAPYGLVVAYDEEGNPVRSFHDPGGELITEVTSAQEKDGYLYLGTLHQQRVARLKLRD